MPAPPIGYRFGPFRVDVARRLLFNGDDRVPLSPKAFDVLLTLIQHAGRVVSRDELLRSCWRDCHVQRVNPTHYVFTLRRALGETTSDHRYIVTVPGEGYQFVADQEATRPAVPPATAIASRRVGPVRSVGIGRFSDLTAASEDSQVAAGFRGALMAALSGCTTTVFDAALAPSDAFITGTVQRAGRRLRANVQVVRAADGVVLWADCLQMADRDVFDLQDAVATRVAEWMSSWGGAGGHFSHDRLGSSSARANYEVGRYLLEKRTAYGLRTAVELFQRAIDDDSSFALPLVGMADAYLLLSHYEWLSPSTANRLAREAALKAISMDGTLAEAYSSLGFASLKVWDWDGAERAFERALTLDPNLATAHQWYADYLSSIGKLDLAIAEMKRALELDPTSLIINTDVGLMYLLARDYPAAIDQLRTTLVIDPEFVHARWALGVCYQQLGESDAAIVELKQAARSAKDSGFVLAMLAHSYAFAGNSREARRLFAELKDLARRQYVSAYNFAIVHLGLRETDRAIAALTEAYREGSYWLATASVEPMLDAIRPDPRFQQLLRRLGLVRRNLPAAIADAAVLPNDRKHQM